LLFISDKGEVFGWGNSEYAQLNGVTTEQQVNSPKSLNAMLAHVGPVVDVAAGGTVCLALNQQGDVFVWGFGLLGKGPALEYANSPTQIPSTLFGRNAFNPDVRPKSVHAGVNTCAVVNTQGELFTWGKNKVKLNKICKHL